MSKVNEFDYQRYIDFYDFVLKEAYDREDEERVRMSEKFKDFLRVEHLTYEEYRKKILDYTLGYGLKYMDTLDLIMRDKYWFDPIAEKEELMRF